MMLSSHGALLQFSLVIDVSTSDGSMDGGSMVEISVESPCKSWSAEALLDLYSTL